MIINGKGGGNTRTGLVFEGKTDLSTFLKSKTGYDVIDYDVFYNGEKVARVFKKHSFYKVFLKELNIDWKQHISKQRNREKALSATLFFVLTIQLIPRIFAKVLGRDYRGNLLLRRFPLTKMIIISLRSRKARRR